MKTLFTKPEIIYITVLTFMFFGCKSNIKRNINQVCEKDVVTEVVGDTLEMKVSGVEDIKNAIPGCESYVFSKDYFLADSIFSLHFEINLALPLEKPEWFIHFLNDYIHKELSDEFFKDSVKPRLFKINNSTSWDKIGKHYFAWMKKNYKKEFPQRKEEDKYLGNDYEFRITAYPIWENGDYITYQIYAYEMPGSMRSRERDFCRTFEKKTGRVLGISDLYSENEFKETLTLLEQQISSAIDVSDVTADVNPKSNVFASPDMVLKEKHNGKLYPRPAVTSEGIIFTYQTYEKAGGGFGILKFTIPYNKSLKD